MCQAYQSEASYVIWKEERDHKAGKPYGCSFQAGYFQCPNEYNQYCLSEDVSGWTCDTCGTFYPRTDK